MVPLILPLDDSRADLAAAGGKGASLARLEQAGLPVPDGFHLTTRAYRERSMEGLLEAFRALGGPVAVRSSATAEDLPGLSFAGQHDTVLDVTEDGLFDARDRAEGAVNPPPVFRRWRVQFTEVSCAWRRAAGARVRAADRSPRSRCWPPRTPAPRPT
ncbi:PEP/pyruvate-binding domain-containing protein [Lentzea rhizosphaerae]|uniref:Phosphoenolpyruvate synthase n=1 Tax=Lentzea rhizosphaerae TaxID=2041025 RepID=A0ABV8BYT1_9PSEU